MGLQMCAMVSYHFHPFSMFSFLSCNNYLSISQKIPEIIVILNQVRWFVGCYINYTEHLASDERTIMCDDPGRIRQGAAVTYFKLPSRIRLTGQRTPAKKRSDRQCHRPTLNRTPLQYKSIAISLKLLFNLRNMIIWLTWGMI
jgi:hypothetical protein